MSVSVLILECLLSFPGINIQFSFFISQRTDSSGLLNRLPCVIFLVRSTVAVQNDNFPSALAPKHRWLDNVSSSSFEDIQKVCSLTIFQFIYPSSGETYASVNVWPSIGAINSSIVQLDFFIPALFRWIENVKFPLNTFFKSKFPRNILTYRC